MSVYGECGYVTGVCECECVGVSVYGECGFITDVCECG